MMINVAIVEDEAEHFETLRKYLNRYADEQHESFSVSVFDNAVTFLEKYTASYDVVFMDVKMPYMNGITAAHKLRQLDGDVILFFVTIMQQYAIRGYELDAMDYIVKPVWYHEFALKFAKAMDRLEARSGTGREMLVPTETGLMKLRLRDIIYVEVKNHHCIFHTNKGDHRQYQSLKYVEERLPSDKFVKCNNYCLVNLAYVEAIRGSVAVVSGEELEISRPRKKEFGRRVAEYYEGRS